MMRGDLFPRWFLCKCLGYMCIVYIRRVFYLFGFVFFIQFIMLGPLIIWGYYDGYLSTYI